MHCKAFITITITITMPSLQIFVKLQFICNFSLVTGISFLMRNYHGSYSDLCHDHPILATKNLSIIHKLGFPEIILPGEWATVAILEGHSRRLIKSAYKLMTISFET